MLDEITAARKSFLIVWKTTVLAKTLPVVLLSEAGAARAVVILTTATGSTVAETVGVVGAVVLLVLVWQQVQEHYVAVPAWEELWGLAPVTSSRSSTSSSKSRVEEVTGTNGSSSRSHSRSGSGCKQGYNRHTVGKLRHRQNRQSQYVVNLKRV